MSEETVPHQGGGGCAGAATAAGQPKGLLQQMDELMAALNADLQSAGSAGRGAVEDGEAG